MPLAVSTETSPAARIVQAASRCFARKGYAGTTITDIELAAGYSPRAGGIYRHFPSKRAILEAVIDAAVDGNEAMIEEMRSSAVPAGVTEPPERIAKSGSLQRG